MLIYGTFATGKTTFIFNNRESLSNFVLDTDLLIQNNVTPFNLEASSEWYTRIASMVNEFIELGVDVFSNLYGSEFQDWKYDVAFLRDSQTTLKLAEKAGIKSPELEVYLANERLYISEFANKVIVMQEDEYIDDFLYVSKDDIQGNNILLNISKMKVRD